ncbi:hypothetical protein QTL97_17990 [Sporosarcina thermotolerans]|uniref:Antitoxin VbhA domain-containing protein n=1 Tax=Sporosarcina thermotolerans TaxID=633404 RepID=A0AAW9AFC2_9BACL|nr:hypothetical protein [Sporosarcina thermotolerans]MDW0118819.1 hypothetical protein [Sporosarcina thermotolerans]WHT48510.1 hypothetical protein QNH10_01315 [Sporosarcina thermotolerans]
MKSSSIEEIDEDFSLEKRKKISQSIESVITSRESMKTLQTPLFTEVHAIMDEDLSIEEAIRNAIDH